jgi:hypothetical protein
MKRSNAIRRIVLSAILTLGTLASVTAGGAAAMAAPNASGKDCHTTLMHTLTDDQGLQATIEQKLDEICDVHDNGQVSQALMNAAFEGTGGKYNVMVFNEKQSFDWKQREGLHFYALTDQADAYADNGAHFGIWVFESGTFVNNGDGGWQNWAFRGQYDRSGNVINFHRP